MKYNVGDKVRIKSLDWWNYNNVDSNNESISYVKCKDWNFISDMKKYCGKILTIKEVHKEFKRYKMSEDNKLYSWTDEMIERLVEEEMKSENELLDEYEELTDRAFKGGYEKCKSDIKLNGFQLPEGYIFKDENGNEILTSKIILEKKKKEYPKTYEECCQYLGCDDKIPLKIIGEFTKLINARNAYWKIAGEGMGLDKPWEPDWHNSEKKYTVEYYDGELIRDFSLHQNRTFSFPTPEVRDAFKENFDKDLETCKEFL